MGTEAAYPHNYDEKIEHHAMLLEHVKKAGNADGQLGRKQDI